LGNTFLGFREGILEFYLFTREGIRKELTQGFSSLGIKFLEERKPGFYIGLVGNYGSGGRLLGKGYEVKKVIPLGFWMGFGDCHLWTGYGGLLRGELGED